MILIYDQTQDVLLKWLGLKASLFKFFAVENGILLDEYRNAKKYDRQIIIKDVKKSDGILCMIGSFMEQRNHLLVLDVTGQFSENFKLFYLEKGNS